MGFSTQLQNNILNICAVTRTRFACVQRHKKKYIYIYTHSTSGLAVNEDGPGLSEEVPGTPSMPGRPVLIATASSSTGVRVIERAQSSLPSVCLFTIGLKTKKGLI